MATDTTPGPTGVTGNPVVPGPSLIVTDASGLAGPQSRISAPYLADKLKEAELLLSYTAELGVDVDDKVRDAVLRARIENDGGGMTKSTAGDLLTALTALAAKVKPVTVASLQACANRSESDDEVSLYRNVAIGIGLVIVFFSLCTFVSNRVSEQIKKDIETANALASKLRSELGPTEPTKAVSTETTAASSTATPLTQEVIWFGTNAAARGLSGKDVIADLQQFAATMREIHGYAGQLKYFLLEFDPPRYVTTLTNRAAGGKILELTPGLKVPLAQELTDKVEEYQLVRNFANGVQQKVTVYYGALATCVLPVLYALLGAGAYLLRLHEDQIKTRTFTGQDRHVARFLIAGIGGLVVGLFDNVTGNVTISPFAVAFLVGYAVDVFFTFLEGLLQMFRKGPAGGAAGAPNK